MLGSLRVPRSFSLRPAVVWRMQRRDVNAVWLFLKACRPCLLSMTHFLRSEASRTICLENDLQRPLVSEKPEDHTPGVSFFASSSTLRHISGVRAAFSPLLA